LWQVIAMREVEVVDLVEGMILQYDVLGINDVVLLTRGTVLNNLMIEKLIRADVYYVYIKDDNIKNSVNERNDSIDRSTVVVKKLSLEYNKCLEGFQNVYDEVGLGKKLQTEAIEESIVGLISETIKSNNVLGRIRRIDASDDYTYKHSINVCILSTMIGKWLGYKGKKLRSLSMAALLHDIGKAKMPSEILNKKGKLTLEEYEIAKQHAVMGYKILKENNTISMDVCLGVLQHHERMDGSGYSMGVKGEKIHEFAKIIAVADIFDAMTSKRVHKDKESPFKVAEQIADGSFEILDPVVSNCFLYHISKYYVGNIVKLNTGEIGEIILVHQEVPTKPLIKVHDRFVDLMVEKNHQIIEVIT